MFETETGIMIRVEKDQAKTLFEGLLKKLGFSEIKVTDELVDKWFTIADKDKSGKLSQEEVE